MELVEARSKVEVAARQLTSAEMGSTHTYTYSYSYSHSYIRTLTHTLIARFATCNSGFSHLRVGKFRMRVSRRTGENLGRYERRRRLRKLLKVVLYWKSN